MKKPAVRLSRRQLLRFGVMAGGVSLIGARRAFGWPATCDPTSDWIEPFDRCDTGLGDIEAQPYRTSPFILSPFTDPLPVSPGSDARGNLAPLKSMLPGYRGNDLYAPLVSPGGDWPVRMSGGVSGSFTSSPGTGSGMQDALGARPRSSTDPLTGITYPLPDAGTHQLWPGSGVVAGYPNPILYHIRVQVSTHSFTSSKVQPIDAGGNPIGPPLGADTAFDGSVPNVLTGGFGGYSLPASTIYGFNGTFPGPIINTMYGQPYLIRFENDLDYNPLGRDRQDFGAPDWAFLTHQHNGHTAPESDGQPHHMTDHGGGYQPQEWVDNLYLAYPAGGDPNETQSFTWFHDHRMHHTGANVYKGMVGLTPHYDPVLDTGDETGVTRPGKRSSRALRLPGIKVVDPADPSGNTFNVKYDIPLALYDWLADDGVTQHQDFHNGAGELHPEWWGQSFFRHFPNHGFVGDIFTINGVAYPVLHVYQRKYRLRFLDASIARLYQLWLMSSSTAPVAAPGSQGQWQLPNGQQCMKLTQVASEGGLLPAPIVRDSFELWPAKRREFVVDFSKYMDNTRTKPGDVIWLVNTLEMPTGRKPSFAFDPEPGANPNYKVPMLKIVIGGPPPERDQSVIPRTLRPMPQMLGTPSTLPSRRFELQRGGTAGGETQWLINSLEFDPLKPLALPRQGQPETWTVVNGGGGWVHPMHMHYEEHRVLSRNGVAAPDARHPDDTGREDVVALDPSESVTFYRNFRTFYGKYVAHCHNLAHEDHNMMFGWTVVP